MSQRAAFWLVGLAFVVAVEDLVYRSYAGHEARSAWFTHVYVGGSVALLVMAAWTVQERRRVRFAGLWVMLGQLVAMVPDILFRFGMPHRMWMDAFLGHLSSPFVPGRNWTWFAVFALCLALWLATDARLQARAERRAAIRRRSGHRRRHPARGPRLR